MSYVEGSLIKMFHLGGYSGTKSKYLTVNVEFSSAFVVLGFNSDFVHVCIVCKARMTCGLLKLLIKWSLILWSLHIIEQGIHF